MSKTDSPTAVVTGGSKGIGADIAERLLDRGYRVVNLSNIPPTWNHDRLETIEVDLSNLNATRETAAAIVADHEVTVFVHNAGVIRPALLENVKQEDLDHLVSLHLGAAIALAQQFLPSMRAKNFGRIVLISSRAALGLPTRTAYSATKAGMIGLTRTWALELAKDGITVNAIAPGPIETDQFHELIPPDSPKKPQIAASVPVGRLGTPADIGRVVDFLVDRESSFITGQTLYVCGGVSLGGLTL